MDRRQVEALAQRELNRWCEELPLQEFLPIELKIENLPDAYGTCEMAPENRDVTIRIDDERCHTAAKIAVVMKHEMMHVLTAEFQLFWEIVKDEIPPEARPMAERNFDAMWEIVVQRLERCWPEDE